MDVKQHKIHGFTVFELIITIVILSILSCYAYFLWSNSTVSVKAQAWQIATDIRYAQSLSMSHGLRYQMIEASSNSYQILDSSSNAVVFPNGSTTVTLNSGITFTAWSNLSHKLINFDGKGAPYLDTGSPGTALQANKTYTITITGGSDTGTITITPITGMVTVS